MQQNLMAVYVPRVLADLGAADAVDRETQARERLDEGLAQLVLVEV